MRTEPTLRFEELTAAAHPGQRWPWFVRLPERLSQDLAHLRVAHLMTLLAHGLELTLIVTAALAALLVVRWLLLARQRRRMAAAGTCLELVLPEQVERAALAGLGEKLAAQLPRPRLGAAPWIGLDVRVWGQRLRALLFCSEGVPLGQVRSAVQAALPGCALKPPGRDTVGHADGDRVRVVPSGCALVPLGDPMLPLRMKQEIDPSRQILASLGGETNGEGGIVQFLFAAAPRRVRRRALKRARKLLDPRPRSAWLGPMRLLAELATEFLDLFLPGGGSSYPRTGGSQVRTVPVAGWRRERAELLQKKASEPLLQATVRLATFAPDRGQARERLRGLAASFSCFNAEGKLRRGHEPFFWRHFWAWLPPLRPRLILTTAEVAAMLPLPEQRSEAPLELAELPARTLVPVADAPRQGLLLGGVDRAGIEAELRVTVEALLRHAHLLAPTGKGKSTLLANLVLEALKHDVGLFLLDPKGDLVGYLLNRIPAEHIPRVELLDLGDEQHPVALNLLACEPGEGDRQVEALLAIFRRLFSRYWGPRSEDLLRAALATLLTTPRAAGEPVPTLADVLLLLGDRPHPVAPAGADPVALARFWAHWGRLSPGQREQAWAPLANKLRALLGSRMLRNLLCQPEAPSFEEIIREGRVVLCSLPLGQLGEDAGALLGSVLVHRLWQTAARLGPYMSDRRPPFLCLLDEFHHFTHLPQGLAAALAEARGYGLGFVLAHQNLGQLRDNPELYEAIDGNAQTKLCFALPHLDAKRMEPHFAPRLTAADLGRLGAYQLACRIEHRGRQLPAATCDAQPMPIPVAGKPARRIQAIAHAHSKSRREVEAWIARRYGLRDDEPPAQGRGEADSPSGGPPAGPPFGPPPDGGPADGPNRHDSGESAAGGNPDEDQSIPSSLA